MDPDRFYQPSPIFTLHSVKVPPSDAVKPHTCEHFRGRMSFAVLPEDTLAHGGDQTTSCDWKQNLSHSNVCHSKEDCDRVKRLCFHRSSWTLEAGAAHPLKSKRDSGYLFERQYFNAFLFNPPTFLLTLHSFLNYLNSPPLTSLLLLSMLRSVLPPKVSEVETKQPSYLLWCFRGCLV